MGQGLSCSHDGIVEVQVPSRRLLIPRANCNKGHHSAPGPASFVKPVGKKENNRRPKSGGDLIRDRVVRQLYRHLHDHAGYPILLTNFDVNFSAGQRFVSRG